MIREVKSSGNWKWKKSIESRVALQESKFKNKHGISVDENNRNVLSDKIWATIPETNNEYKISPSGDVLSCKYKGLFIKDTSKNDSGRILVSLRINGKTCMRQVHRLVALTYIPNPENKPEVNHINGDCTDNRVENLEWATRKENMEHAFSTGLIQNKTVPVIQLDESGKFINSFPSISLAKKHTMGSCKHISACINNKRKTSGGFIWLKVE